MCGPYVGRQIRLSGGCGPDRLTGLSVVRVLDDDWLQDGHMYGGAGVVALVGLMTGLKPRADMVVQADVHVVRR